MKLILVTLLVLKFLRFNPLRGAALRSVPFWAFLFVCLKIIYLYFFLKILLKCIFLLRYNIDRWFLHPLLTLFVFHTPLQRESPSWFGHRLPSFQVWILAMTKSPSFALAGSLREFFIYFHISIFCFEVFSDIQKIEEIYPHILQFLQPLLQTGSCLLCRLFFEANLMFSLFGSLRKSRPAPSEGLLNCSATKSCFIRNQPLTGLEAPTHIPTSYFIAFMNRLRLPQTGEGRAGDDIHHEVTQQ